MNYKGLQNLQGSLSTTGILFVVALVATGLAVLGGPGGLAMAQDADCDPEEFICIDVFDEEEPEEGSGRWEPEERVWIIEPARGYVQVAHKQNVVTAASLRWHDDDQRAVLQGDVEAVRPDTRITSNVMTAFFEREEFIFEGDVTLIQFEQDAPEGEGEARELRTISARLIEFSGDTGDLTARGDVRAIDEDYHIWSDELVFEDAAQLMHLAGSVRVEGQDPEMTMTGQRFRYDLDTSDVRLIGGFRIEMRARD